MTTPGLAALLWLGAFPPLKVVLVGLLTVFAGYSAVYALNDLIDYRSDKKKMEEGFFQDTEGYLDGVMVRHPVAQGLLKFREGLGWTLGWALVAVVGAFILNPVCVMIFIGGCLLEAVYCLMWRLSWTRTIVSGGVKTSGAIAAVYAVDPEPSFSLLLILFFWLFFWEIGGQNIPNDWEDLEREGQDCSGPVRAGNIVPAGHGLSYYDPDHERRPFVGDTLPVSLAFCDNHLHGRCLPAHTSCLPALSKERPPKSHQSL